MTLLTARVPLLAAVGMAALFVIANAGEATAAAGGDYVTCSLQSSDIVVPPGGEASIVITVAYNVTRAQTLHVSMEPVAGYAFTSGRFLALPAGAKTSTGNLTVKSTNLGSSFERTAVLVDGKACAPVTVQTGASTSTAGATVTSSGSTTTTTTSAPVSTVVSTSTVTTTATVTRTTNASSATSATVDEETTSSSAIVSSLVPEAAISQEAHQLRSSLSAFSDFVLLLQVAAGASIAAMVGLAVRSYVKKRPSKKESGPPPRAERDSAGPSGHQAGTPD